MVSRNDYSSRIHTARLQQELEVDLHIQPHLHTDEYSNELSQQIHTIPEQSESGFSFDNSFRNDSKLGNFISFGPSESLNSPKEVSKDIQLHEIKLEPYLDNSSYFDRGFNAEYLLTEKVKNSLECRRSSGDSKVLDSKRTEEDSQKGLKAKDVSRFCSTPIKIIEISSDKMESTKDFCNLNPNSANQLTFIKKGEKLPVLLNKSEDGQFKSPQLTRSGSSVTDSKSPSLKYQKIGHSRQETQSSDFVSPTKNTPLSEEKKTDDISRPKESFKRIMISSESEKSFGTDSMAIRNLSRINSSQDHDGLSISQNPINKSEGGLNSLLTNRKISSNRSGSSSRSSSASITLKERRRNLHFDKPVARFSSLSPEKYPGLHDSALLEKSRESSDNEEVKNPVQKTKGNVFTFNTAPEILQLETSREGSTQREGFTSPVKTVSIVKRVNLKLKLPTSKRSEIPPDYKSPIPQSYSLKKSKISHIKSLETETLKQTPTLPDDLFTKNTLGDIKEATDSSLSREYTNRVRYNSTYHESPHHNDSRRFSTKKNSKITAESDIISEDSHNTIDSYSPDLIKKTIHNRQNKYRNSAISQRDIHNNRSRQRSSDGLCDTESEDLHSFDRIYYLNPQVEEEKIPKAHKRSRRREKQLEEINISAPSLDSTKLSSKRQNSKDKSKHKSKQKSKKNQENPVSFRETYDISDQDGPNRLSTSPISYTSDEHNSLNESPAKTIQELFDRLNSLETPIHSSKRRPFKKNDQSWIQKMFACCFVSTKVSKYQSSAISLIDVCSSLNFDERNSLHLSILTTLFHHLTNSSDSTPRMSNQWIKIGFTTQDPVSELTKLNLLSLINLSFFSLALNTQLKFILQTSKSEGSRFELISTSTTISNHAYLSFKSGSLSKFMKNADPWHFENLYYVGVFLWWFNLYMTKSKIYNVQVLFLRTFEHATKNPRDMLTLAQQKMDLMGNH